MTYETSFYVSNYNMMMGKIWKFCVTNLMTGMFTTKVHAPKRITKLYNY